MREGLRSRSKLLAKVSTGEQGSDSTDDNATKLIGSGPVKVKCGFDSKREAEMDKRDGSKSEEFGAEGDVGVLEGTNSKKKRSRTDDRGGESEEDSAKKRKSKENNEDGKAQVVCRVLRSMSAVKSESKEDVQRTNVGGDSIGRRTRGRAEDKSVNVVKSENKEDVQRKNIDGEYIGQTASGRSGSEDKMVDVVISESKESVQWKNTDGDTIGKRTRGSGGFEDKIVNVVICESKEDVQKKSLDGDCIGKRTRGRGGSEDKSVDVVISEGNDYVQKKNIDSDSIGKRTRGRGGSDDKSLNVVMKEGNQFNDEHHNMLETMEKNEELGKLESPSKSQESRELQGKWADVKKGEIDQSAHEESHQFHDQVSMKLKRKRGRPFKTQKSNESAKNLIDKGGVNQFATREIHQPHNKVSKKLKRKRGRPPKAKEGSEIEKTRDDPKKEGIDITGSRENYQPNNEMMKLLKPRRGRPPKAQNCVLSKKKMSKAEEAGQCDGRGSHHQNNEVKDNIKPKRGRPFKLNKGKPGNLGKGDLKLLKVKKMKCHKVGMEGGEGKKKAGETGHSRSERQAVRDKIVELLLGAGWEIQYRPRYGRLYNDAVYVNPEGRTHWSITLAYRVLKEYFEDGTIDSKACKSGFKFIPIPEEELSILTKVMNKERSDKNKKKKKRNKEEEDELVAGATKKRKWKLQTRKLGPSAGLGHTMLKGRSKLKSLHHKNRSSGMTGSGTAVSVRDRKRLETHGRKRCGLMVRNSQDGTKSDSDRYFLYNGKRTLLTWMIDLGTLALDGRVEYLESRKPQSQLKGRIKTDGIQCDCCTKTFTIAEFETHAGGKSCQPCENIFLETGSSLLQCQLDSWHKQDGPAKKGFHLVDISGEDPNDDTCGICGDGGDLICCDGCPSTFHKSCLEIKKFPSGPWHCIYCLCKFCGKVGGNGCQENDDTALSHGLFTCFMCEEKYHQSCVQVKDSINKDRSNTSFCGEKCQKLHERLQMLLGVKHELEGGFSWTFVRRFDVGSDVSLSGMPRKVNCNSKVAVALHIMDECFMPMVDHRSGVNLIRNIVYNFGSNFNRLNYTGFFTAILERGDEMIAAASIRIHGNQLAEMPFIGTRYVYRRQGMCRRLLSAIEMALCSLNVEKLVIPAISELRGTWSSVFGFKPLEGSSKKLLRNLNVMVFPGVDMLQKPLMDHQFTEQAVHPKEGSQSSELVELLTMEKGTNESDRRCSVRVDLKDSGETGATHLSNEVSRVAALKSGSLVEGCVNDASDVIIKNANTVQCCHQSCMVSDNLDGGNVNIMCCLDSSCDAHQQTGNEKINSFNRICSSGSNLEVFSDVPHEGNIISEPAAAECVSLPNGCLDETLNTTTQDASKTKCQDQSCVISGNLDGRNKNVVNLLGCSCNTLEQTADNAGQGNALFASIVISTDSTFQPLQGQLNQNNVSEADNKLCEVFHVGSEAANCSGEFPRASVDSSRTICCEVKADGDVECNPNSCGKNSVHSTSEVIALETPDSFIEHGVKVSYSNAAFCDSKTSSISSSVGKSAFPESQQRTRDLLTSCSAALPIEQNMSSAAESKGSDGHAKDVTLARADNPSHMTSDITRPNLHDSSSDAPCMLPKVVSGCCNVNVHDLEDVSTTARNGALSTVGGLVSDKALLDAKLTKLTGSDSDFDNAPVTQCNSECSCSLSSNPAIALHCAPGSSNSCMLLR